MDPDAGSPMKGRISSRLGSCRRRAVDFPHPESAWDLINKVGEGMRLSRARVLTLRLRPARRKLPREAAQAISATLVAGLVGGGGVRSWHRSARAEVCAPSRRPRGRRDF